uniref:Uncharacterized protein n=1 Tax=Mola mola TaxID=94237 RepID=A0A3Q4AQA8_MOLML
MAIAHVATEYMSSDFLPKDPNQARYRSLRTELAVEENSDLLGSGPALFPHLSPFAQEVSVGTQISCFAPTNFSWRQAANVDSYFWAVVHTHSSSTETRKITLGVWDYTSTTKLFAFIIYFYLMSMTAKRVTTGPNADKGTAANLEMLMYYG